MSSLTIHVFTFVQIKEEVISSSTESHAPANIGEYYLRLYLEEEMKRIKNDWT